MNLNHGYPASFKARNIDITFAYNIALAEIAAALHLDNATVTGWLGSYNGRLFGSEVAFHIAAESDNLDVHIAVRRVMRRWLRRPTSAEQQSYQ
ncbi:hypothetical protein [Paralysiella testudinis]|uniref:Uncharacterized protein n=1 Tax=Paralysiella testudinis TaxID=2809020 RepID=A0A892ZM10_9NEIS|nr:hypothetical protein [Paralysiella testudinis]QRQ81919.1 hypothetical protein JQU52_00265 [Paralysiella testudinis]